MREMLTRTGIPIITAITEKVMKSFPKKSHRLNNRKGGFNNECSRFFKVLTNLKIFGEYHDGNTHYWTDVKFDDDGEKYTLIVADIPHEKFTEQITCKVKEL